LATSDSVYKHATILNSTKLRRTKANKLHSTRLRPSPSDELSANCDPVRLRWSHVSVLDYTECPFYRLPEYGSCHGMCPADTGILCDKTVVFEENIKETRCIIKIAKILPRTSL
jgi:hypothetical protein